MSKPQVSDRPPDAPDELLTELIIGQRRTWQSGWPFALALAFATVASLWYLHTSLPIALCTAQPPVQPIDRLLAVVDRARAMLFGEGPIPFVILGTFLFGLFTVGGVWAFVDRRLHPARSRHPEWMLYQLELRFERDHDLAATTTFKNDLMESLEDEIARRFIAVTFSEWAMPLLGFLGTVVGLTGALGSIKTAVTIQMANQAQNPQSGQATALFNSAFGEMAIAFDTTFLGLLGLLLVGLLHQFVKKRIARHLSEIRNTLTAQISTWKSRALGRGGEDPVLRGEVAGLWVDLSSQLRNAEDFRHKITAVVLTVVQKTPELKYIKDALFASVTAAEPIGDALNDAVAGHLQARAAGRSWQISGVASSVKLPGYVVMTATIGEANRGAAASIKVIANARDPRAIEVLDIPDRIVRLFPADRKSALLARTTEDALIYAVGDQRRVLAKEFTGADHACAVCVGEETALVSLRNAAGVTRLQAYSTAADGGAGGERLELWTNPGPLHLAGHASSGALAVLDGHSDRPRLAWTRLRMQHQQGKKRGAPDAPMKPVLTFDRNVPSWELPPSTMPDSFVLLSDHDGVFLDQGGHLHHWDGRLQRPVRLHHPQWVPHANGMRILIPGRNRWVAVIAGGNVRWWHVSFGHDLEPYTGKPLPAGDLAGVGFTLATTDGEVLLCMGSDRKRLFGWVCPTVVGDL